MSEPQSEPNGEQPPELPLQADQVSTSNEELQKLRNELAEYKDKYLRVLAESENTRKRMIKERQENARQAVADVIGEFLKPLDQMESALSFAQKMSQEIQNWATGFQMILGQFKDVLSANGVTPVTAKGQQFDPHLHEAIEMMETEKHPPGMIVEEYTRGYKMGDRTIRPARVKVAQAIKAPSPIEQDEDGEDEISLNKSE